jgi:hypothetical protein
MIRDHSPWSDSIGETLPREILRDRRLRWLASRVHGALALVKFNRFAASTYRATSSRMNRA